MDTCLLPYSPCLWLAGKIYLVTELMRDGDLFDYIVSNSKLTEVQAKPLVRDMLNALAHMHERGIIHRDL